MVSALEGVVSRPAFFAKFHFDSGDVRLWTGYGNVDFDGETYLGAGDLIGYELPQESNGQRQSGVTLTLQGIENTWISVGLTEDYQGRDCEIWYAELDASAQVVNAPIRLFKGLCDTLAIQETGETCTVALTVERAGIDFRADNSRYDNEDQQRRFPGDKGFEFLPTLEEMEIPWGVPTTNSASVAQPGNTGATSQPPLGGPGRTNRAPSAVYTGSTGGLGGAGRTNRGQGSSAAGSGSGSSTGGLGGAGRTNRG
jgi:hypothetical protein